MNTVEYDFDYKLDNDFRRRYIFGGKPYSYSEAYKIIDRESYEKEFEAYRLKLSRLSVCQCGARPKQVLFERLKSLGGVGVAYGDCCSRFGVLFYLTACRMYQPNAEKAINEWNEANKDNKLK